MRLGEVLTAEDLRGSKGNVSAYDATKYEAVIREASTRGVGGIVILDDGDVRRTEKRRLSVAAKATGHTLKWRKGERGTLRFLLDGAGARNRATVRIVDTERELVAV